MNGFAQKLKIGVTTTVDDLFAYYQHECNFGLTTLAAALLMSCMYLLCTSAITFKGPDKEHDPEVCAAWWTIYRAIFLLIIVLTVIGLSSTALAVQVPRL